MPMCVWGEGALHKSLTPIEWSLSHTVPNPPLHHFKKQTLAGVKLTRLKLLNGITTMCT